MFILELSIANSDVYVPKSCSCGSLLARVTFKTNCDAFSSEKSDKKIKQVEQCPFFGVRRLQKLLHLVL